MVSTCMLGHTYSASVGPSEALIRCNQRSLRSSEVIRGHQRSSVVISGHQWSSEVIRGTHQNQSKRENERERAHRQGPWAARPAGASTHRLS